MPKNFSKLDCIHAVTQGKGTFTDDAVYREHETSILWCHFHLGDMFSVSIKGRTGGLGECTERVQAAWLFSHLITSVTWLALLGSLLLCTNQLRKQSSFIVGPPFLAVKIFPSLDGQSSAESYIWLLKAHYLVGVIKVTNVHRMAARALVWSLGA